MSRYPRVGACWPDPDSTSEQFLRDVDIAWGRILIPKDGPDPSRPPEYFIRGPHGDRIENAVSMMERMGIPWTGSMCYMAKNGLACGDGGPWSAYGCGTPYASAKQSPGNYGNQFRLMVNTYKSRGMDIAQVGNELPKDDVDWLVEQCASLKGFVRGAGLRLMTPGSPLAAIEACAVHCDVIDVHVLPLASGQGTWYGHHKPILVSLLLLGKEVRVTEFSALPDISVEACLREMKAMGVHSVGIFGGNRQKRDFPRADRVFWNGKVFRPPFICISHPGDTSMGQSIREVYAGDPKPPNPGPNPPNPGPTPPVIPVDIEAVLDSTAAYRKKLERRLRASFPKKHLWPTTSFHRPGDQNKLEASLVKIEAEVTSEGRIDRSVVQIEVNFLRKRHRDRVGLVPNDATKPDTAALRGYEDRHNVESYAGDAAEMEGYLRDIETAIHKPDPGPGPSPDPPDPPGPDPEPDPEIDLEYAWSAIFNGRSGVQAAIVNPADSRYPVGSGAYVVENNFTAGTPVYCRAPNLVAAYKGYLAKGGRATGDPHKLSFFEMAQAESFANGGVRRVTGCRKSGQGFLCDYYRSQPVHGATGVHSTPGLALEELAETLGGLI